MVNRNLNQSNSSTIYSDASTFLTGYDTGDTARTESNKNLIKSLQLDKKGNGFTKEH